MSAVRPWLQGRVLDIGCGSGALAEWCDKEAYVGFDPDAASVEIARRKWPDHKFVVQLPSSEKFDTIIALAVIEHLPDPKRELGGWASCLAPLGRLVLTTPHRAFHKIHDIGAMLGVFSSSAAEEHEEMFDKGSLHRLAVECGLRPIKYERFLWGANQLFAVELDRRQSLSQAREKEERE